LRLFLHWNILLLLGFRVDCVGLVDHNLGGFIVGRVASGAELLADAGLTNTLLDDLLERAAGIGQRLLICRIAGAATLTRRGTTEASLVFEFFSITIIVFTATLPRRAARERSDYRKVAIVGVVEIAVCVGIYRVWGGGCRGG